MADRHYDDEALISFLEAGDPQAAASDPHLRTCTPCNETYATIRTLAETMKLDEVWDPRSLPDASAKTLSTLRGFADQMAREDSAADAVLQSLLATPRETWTAQVEANAGWWTGGMVRRVLGAAERAIDTHPPDALELTAIATRLADRLDADAYPGETVAKLRGAAWRDRGYALYYTGSFAAAEQAVLAAERHFSGCMIEEYDQARVGIVKTLVLRETERPTQGVAVAASSHRTFADFGDDSRRSSAAMATAHLHVQMGDYSSAVGLLKAELGRAEAGDRRARLLANIAYCCTEMGHPVDAIPYLREAMSIYAELGVQSECARVRWNLARARLAVGDRSVALHQLLQVVQEFDQHTMASEATLASLDIAEIYLGEERYADVEAICTSALNRLREAGLAYTAPAMTAFAYLREAVAHRRQPRQVLTHVRTFVRKLPRQPQMLFATLPD